MIYVALATEDELSEAIGIRLLEERALPMQASLLLRKGGAGYLLSGINKWCKLSLQQPVILLTDLDRKACPAALISEWMGTKPIPENLLIRVAVREVESWLLADHDAMRCLIGTRGKLPANPDALPDPKQHLLRLAKHASRDVRSDLIAGANSVSSQGIGYNARLSALVKNRWSPAKAATRSESLARAIQRLDELSRRVCNQI